MVLVRPAVETISGRTALAAASPSAAHPTKWQPSGRVPKTAAWLLNQATAATRNRRAKRFFTVVVRRAGDSLMGSSFRESR